MLDIHITVCIMLFISAQIMLQLLCIYSQFCRSYSYLSHIKLITNLNTFCRYDFSLSFQVVSVHTGVPYDPVTEFSGVFQQMTQRVQGSQPFPWNSFLRKPSICVKTSVRLLGMKSALKNQIIVVFKLWGFLTLWELVRLSYTRR